MAVNTLVEAEQRWAEGSPQADLVAAVFNGDQWHPYIEYTLATEGFTNHRQGVLNAIANLYFVSQVGQVEEAHLPLLTEALGVITNHGSYDQIGRAVMRLLPFEVPAGTNFADEARGFLGHIVSYTTIHIGAPGTVSSDGMAKQQLEAAARSIAEHTNYGEHEPLFAGALVEKFAPSDKAGKVRFRTEALRHHLSASPRAPLYSMRGRDLAAVLRGIDTHYEAWRRMGNGPADDSEEHISLKQLLRIDDVHHSFTTMRQVLEQARDPDTIYAQINEVLQQLLTAAEQDPPADANVEPAPATPTKTTAPPVQISYRPAPAAAAAVRAARARPEAILWPSLPELVDDLTLEQAVEALLTLHTVSEPVFETVLDHLQRTGQATFNNSMIDGVRIMQGLFTDYYARLTVAHSQDSALRAAYIVATRVWGLDEQPPAPLREVLGGLPNPGKYQTAFRRLCLNVLVSTAAMAGRTLYSIVKTLEARAAAKGGN